MSERESAEEFCELMEQARVLLGKDPSYIELPDNKPIVFIGDSHGDNETTEEIKRRFLGSHTMVWLGDYPGRSSPSCSSIRNIEAIMNSKVLHPENVFLLRGNHDFADVYIDTDNLPKQISEAFANEAPRVQEQIELTFQQLPYVAVTQNGVIALHGGLPCLDAPHIDTPRLSLLDQLKSIPKGLTESISTKSLTACEVVWNDHVNDSDIALKEGFEINRDRGMRLPIAFKYGEPIFSQRMDELGKKVLVRGHDYRAKGLGLNDRVLTVFSSRQYANQGSLNGIYVAVIDNPKEPIQTARDLRLVFFN